MSRQIVMAGDWRILTNADLQVSHLKNWCTRLKELTNCEWRWDIEDSNGIRRVIKLQPDSPLEIPEGLAATAYCSGLQDAMELVL